MTPATAGWVGAIAIALGALVVAVLFPLEWRELDVDVDEARKAGM